jgi:hypothetical protein
MDSIRQWVVGPVKGNVVYLVLSPDGDIRYIGSTKKLKARWGDQFSYLRLARKGHSVVSVGPFTTRAKAYRVEDILLRALTPSLNKQHFVPSSLLLKPREASALYTRLGFQHAGVLLPIGPRECTKASGPMLVMLR